MLHNYLAEPVRVGERLFQLYDCIYFQVASIGIYVQTYFLFRLYAITHRIYLVIPIAIILFFAYIGSIMAVSVIISINSTPAPRYFHCRPIYYLPFRSVLIKSHQSQTKTYYSAKAETRNIGVWCRSLGFCRLRDSHYSAFFFRLLRLDT